jgi:hypothetical protein
MMQTSLEESAALGRKNIAGALFNTERMWGKVSDVVIV